MGALGIVLILLTIGIIFRSILALPHVSAIRNWTSSINGEPEFFKDVLSVLEKLESFDKHCNLVIDAMAIKQQIIWDPKSKQFIGYCDFGINLDIECTNNTATEALVFMLTSCNGKWKIPIGYVLQNKIGATAQAELIKCALSLTHAAGLKVWSITCATNFSTMKKLGCNLNVDNYDDIQCSFKLPITNDNVYFIPDACHMLKLVRNTLGNIKEINSNKGTIMWSYIENLHFIQQELSFKLSNKLSASHIFWKNNKMKVKFAAQTLSTSTADALEYLRLINYPNFSNTEATVEYCRNIDRLFDFLNARNHFAKGFKSAIFKANIQVMENKILPLIDYLFSLSIGDKLLYKTNKKTFIFGFATAVKSMFAIAKSLFTECPEFKYILSYKFSQDHLEIFFARVRQSYFNPSIHLFQLAGLRLVTSKLAITS